MSDLTLSLDFCDDTVNGDFDPLTGTLTRQTFFRRLTEATQLAVDAVAPYSLCIADIDQFKNINDRHGQIAGDEVLLAVANRVRELLTTTAQHPNEHLLARYDGNSFLLLMQKTSLVTAADIAESLRHAIASEPTGHDLDVTVSIGVAQYRIGESADDTLARAEQALHLAKQSGRDRVEVIETPEIKNESGNVIPNVIPWERRA